jgi:hypothetical protein
MKSNYGGVQAARQQRAVEAQTLIDRLEAVRTHFNDQDIIIIGDTNCLNADEDALEAIIDAGFTDLNAGDQGTFITGAPFDRVLVPTQQAEFRFSRQYILVSADVSDHDRFLSDHYLIQTAVNSCR